MEAVSVFTDANAERLDTGAAEEQVSRGEESKSAPQPVKDCPRAKLLEFRGTTSLSAASPGFMGGQHGRARNPLAPIDDFSDGCWISRGQVGDLCYFRGLAVPARRPGEDA